MTARLETVASMDEAYVTVENWGLCFQEEMLSVYESHLFKLCNIL
jgi:hypothetical protein